MRARFEPVQPGKVSERSAESAADGKADGKADGAGSACCNDAVTLRDWQGGSLQLTLLPVERALLLEACRLVLHAPPPANMNMVKVSTMHADYLVSRRVTRDGLGELRIGSLYEPAAAVQLPYEGPDELLATLRDSLGAYSSSHPDEGHAGEPQA